jgi:hypothetical protein
MANVKSQISKDTPTSIDSSQKPMSLEEARAAMWLRNDYRYHRPMGELLDEGYLNQSRLEWATENAYDTKIKQAAAVILASVRQTEPASPQAVVHKPAVAELPTLEVGMTIEQARATLWPFQYPEGLKGQPMGTLVDTKQLMLKNLEFAIDRAKANKDERVWRAAVVLASVRLEQIVKEPPPPAGPLKILSAGRSYAERRQYQWTLILGMIFGSLFTICAVMILYSFSGIVSRVSQPSLPLPSIPPNLLPIAVTVLVVVIVIIGGGLWLFCYLVNSAINRIENEIGNYRKGQEGEDRVVEVMRQHLDGNWTLFRNVILPGRNKGDIDAVLVGPPGVWALEIKTFAGEYRNIGEQWEYRSGKGWNLHKPSPSHQARHNAGRLSDFLKADGISRYVDKAVVWAERTEPLVENPSVAVWTLDHLPEQLGNIWQGKTILESDRARIIEKLTKLCQPPTVEE